MGGGYRSRIRRVGGVAMALAALAAGVLICGCGNTKRPGAMPKAKMQEYDQMMRSGTGRRGSTMPGMGGGMPGAPRGMQGMPGAPRGMR